ncbi:MAG: hypothetical protein LUF78_00930 [Clostridiales bacterium]|nr:hypothetical protein [Clostridiales bacterium]
MSQKKVDAYKKEKANRQKNMKREKRGLMLEKLIGVIICFAAVFWIFFSAADKLSTSSEEEETVVQLETVMDTSALTDYISALTEDAE